MQNFGVTNKEHYGMLWYFWSGQLFPRYVNFKERAKLAYGWVFLLPGYF